jgi:hypothetical protein
MMHSERIGPLDLANLTIKAWNAWIVGHSVPSLRLTDVDRTSPGFPRLKWT